MNTETTKITVAAHPVCGGEVSPISYRDMRLSCDGCGDVLPCCAKAGPPMSAQFAKMED